MEKTVSVIEHYEEEITQIHPSQMGSPDFKIFVLNVLNTIKDVAKQERGPDERIRTR